MFSSKFIGAWEDLGLMEAGEGDYGWVTGEALGYTRFAACTPQGGSEVVPTSADEGAS